MKTMKTARGTARAARRAKMDHNPRPAPAEARPKGAALHRLAASLA